MDEKTKLYIFDKKEVALLFIFMVLIAVTSFVFGVRIGKNYSYKMAGFEKVDQQRVDLLSAQEEKVVKVVKEQKIKPKTEKEKVIDKTYDKLKLEFDKLDEQSIGTEKKVDSEPVESDDIKPNVESSTKQQDSAPIEMTEKADVANLPKTSVKAPTEEVSGKVADSKFKNDKLKDKFTIQLGSHRSIKDAEKFADGFRIRGYNPIISEVELQGQGIWFRVSLGVFDNIGDAKKYIVKEKALLQGQDYVINRFD